MEIAVIGLSYKNTDVALRGEAAFTTSMKCQAIQVFKKNTFNEFMILSTCNRSEIYNCNTRYGTGCSDHKKLL